MRHYLWIALIALFVTGCSSLNEEEHWALYEITDKRNPELEINEIEYKWKDNRSYASNIVSIAGGQYGLHDSLSAGNAQREATAGSRIFNAALNLYGGQGLLGTAAHDRAEVGRSEKAEFNPFVVLFVDEDELREGLVDKLPIEFVRQKLETQFQLALSEFHDDTAVTVYIHNAATDEHLRSSKIRRIQKPGAAFYITVEGGACHDAIAHGYIRNSRYGSGAQPDKRVAAIFIDGLPSVTSCNVYVSVESLGFQVLPWSGGVKTHAFKIDTFQRSLSTSLAGWVPSANRTQHLTWVVSNSWYSGEHFMHTAFPYVTGGGRFWTFTHDNYSFGFDE